jgi:ATP-dependent Clp protease ATP-binding subunit ClpB
LSHRYISDRFLPDKAIDLVDEASSRLRMEVDSKPEELDELDRRIVQLKIEQEALKKEKDPASKDRLKALAKELAELEKESAELTAVWTAEKGKLASAQKIKEALDHARSELEIAQRKGDLARAGELKYGRIPELERELAKVEAAEGKQMVNEEVTAEDSTWKRRSKRASSASARRSSRSPMPCAVPARACRIRTGRSARSCSSVRPASARPS